MSNLENLVAKIQRDGEAKAAEITAAAEKEARESVEEQVARAKQEKERILSAAQGEAAHAAEQIRMQNQMDLRDAGLAAKRETLDRVFSQALEELCNMPAEQYRTYLFSALEQLDLDGETLLIPGKYSIGIDEINQHLKSKGKNGNLVMGTAPEQTVDGGFILSKDGIESNNTFGRMIRYHRSALESELMNTLF